MSLENEFRQQFHHQKEGGINDDLPLYKQDLKLVSVQCLDIQTISYLISEFEKLYAPDENLQIFDFFPLFERIDFQKITYFMPDDAWFPNQDFLKSIHGSNCHQRRVLIASILGQAAQLSQSDILRVQIASGVNDIIRDDDRNNSVSRDHAERSAKWFKENSNLFLERGIILSEEDINIISLLIEFHEVPYQEMEAEVIELIGADVVKTHKDSIALDRFRLPKTKWWPKPELLNLEESKQLQILIGLLVLKSEEMYFKAEGQIPYSAALLAVGAQLGFCIDTNPRMKIVEESTELDRDNEDPWTNWVNLARDITPLGYLYETQTQFSPTSQRLLHITGAYSDISKSGLIYPSPGGCMGASVYCTPVSENGSTHNLARFMIQKQIPATQRVSHNLEALIFEFERELNQGTRKKELNYLTFGGIQTQAFATIVEHGLVPQSVLDTISTLVENQISPEIVSLIEMAKIIVQKPMTISFEQAQKFLDCFQRAITKFDFLGYIYFEVFTQYVALNQQDRMSLQLAENGELNTIPYHEIAFRLFPSFEDKFRLRNFSPNLEHLEETLMDHYSKSITNRSSIEFFRMFMAIGMASLLISALKPSESLVAFNGLDKFSTQNPDYFGNLIHRIIRSDPTWKPLHFAYEQQRAKIFWNEWTQQNVLFVSHGIIPKGEIGFNPTLGVQPKIFRGSIQSDLSVVTKDLVENVMIADQILPFEKSLLRHHS